MKFKSLLIIPFLMLGISSIARTIKVKDQQELSAAEKKAVPGDTILLTNGEWNNSVISLSCQGTAESPIVFRAETTGRVVFTGLSRLQIGGSYIIVNGFYFSNGYSGSESVIKFCIDSKKLANNCRVTNTVINDFNNLKRLDENYWISLYGKNNRIDHCSFLNKKNIGVLLAVILDDERSRKNDHQIDHNYFGMRLPLASNAGEIIRVGVSQHCEFNSDTRITDNFFEHCDGETEIISIKSCGNIVRGNLFKECQGGVVLRHGNYNSIENNIFYGNDKEGTGGVRIINKGQWVANNLFYKCRGVGFRSPLSIMNGVPNSPANRYLEVSEAVIINNSFYECTPISFCEGSDGERSVQPHNVKFANNIFYNSKDSQLYNIYDDISRISFEGNLVSKRISQELISGFKKTELGKIKQGTLTIPLSAPNMANRLSDSLLTISGNRLSTKISAGQGLTDPSLLQKTMTNASVNCGAGWFRTYLNPPAKKVVNVTCRSAEEVLNALSKNNKATLSITLTGNKYEFAAPIDINTDVIFNYRGDQKIAFSMPGKTIPFFIQIKAGNSLSMKGLKLDLSGVEAGIFITTDTSGSSDHSGFHMNNCSITKRTGTFFRSAKSSVADRITISDNRFTDNNSDILLLQDESDNKGYYNVEKLILTNNSITNNTGKILSLARTGTDESTMGPSFYFSNNILKSCNTIDQSELIKLIGTQRSLIENNSFQNCNVNKSLIAYEDKVRAVHIYKNNSSVSSGLIMTNKFVTASGNKTN